MSETKSKFCVSVANDDPPALFMVGADGMGAVGTPLSGAMPIDDAYDPLGKSPLLRGMLMRVVTHIAAVVSDSSVVISKSRLLP
ncbi:MAG: hypothetical protein KAJ17_05660, partial [Candidatus Krumholzibacteria bacterium]|nr:hypothetical protein [Candidatus Krumholzibacteria bacterium]